MAEKPGADASLTKIYADARWMEIGGWAVHFWRRTQVAVA